MPAVAVAQVPVADDLATVVISFSTSGDQTIITVSGPPIRIYQLILSAAAATSVTFKDGTIALSGAIPLATGIPFVLDFTSKPFFRCGTSFVVNSSAAVACGGIVYYQ
jgi:hypothetical protein